MADADLPAITAAEMQATREYLGLSNTWVANQLVINERRLVRMEAGQEPQIPQAVMTLLDEVYADAKETVERMVAMYRRKVKAAGDEPVILYTYRTDRDYEDAGGKYPSRWHRHVCARVADAVPGLIIMHVVPETPATGLNVGERLQGVVTNITEFGAFVSLRPGLDGLIHVSQLNGGKRVEDVAEFVSRGDVVDVEVLNIDDKGRVTLKPVVDDLDDLE